MGKKKYLKQIESFKELIVAHRLKIKAESSKNHADSKLINYWKNEILKFEKELFKSQKRLKKGWHKMTVATHNMLEQRLMIMLAELKEECSRYVKLTNQIELENPSEDQLAEILGELTVSTTHLMTQAQNVKEEIEN